MNYPLFEIRLEKIRHNARTLINLCSKHNIQISGVVKSVCGSHEVANALISAGITQLGDSRISNFERLRANGINAEFMMIRSPMLSQCSEIVSLCDYSLNSEMPVIAALGREALKIQRIHKVVLMIDTGDLREGILPEDAPCVAEQITEISGIELVGIGTSLSCYGGIRPTEENMGLLATCAEKIEQRLGRKLDIVSGGNSSSLSLVIAGKMPSKINHLRIGEGILLGQETLECKPLPGTVQDAFVFKAEVIEAGRKPSVPIGEVVRDAFGNFPNFENRGIRRRAILGAGKQDIVPGGLKELVPGMKILGASSDHLLVDTEDCSIPINTGDILTFGVEYSALLSAMTSTYVHKEFVNVKANNSRNTIQLIYAPSSIGANTAGTERAPEALKDNALEKSIAELNYHLAQVVTVERKKNIFDQKYKLEDKLAITNRINKDILKSSMEAFEAENKPLVIGGDHTVTVGAASALLLNRKTQKDVGLIMFGAFANFNTTDCSKSGNLHGMTLAACTDPSSKMHLADKLVFPQENVVLIGLRNLDATERERLKKSRINIFSMEKIDYLGMRETMNQALECLRCCSGGIHVSFSMDVLSPEYAPGVSLPVEGGLDLREAHLAMEILHKSNLLASADLVELNPEYDRDNISVKRALSLLCTLLGKSIL